MKHIKRTFILFSLIVSLFILCACNNNITFTIENKNLDYYVGYSYKPDFIIEGIDEYHLEYDYSSSSIEIINDYIHCLSSDIVVLKVSIKDHSNAGTITLTININEIFPEEIITEKELTIYVNQTKQIELEFKPLNAIPYVSYSVNNKSVASVDENGIVKGLAEGETYIVIKSEIFSDIKTRILIKVEKPPVEKIEVINSIKLNYEETHQLIWNVLPSEADQNVILESSDSSIASIDNNGLITAHKYGEATIKIMSQNNPSIYSDIVVKVEGDKAQEININTNDINLDLGETYELNYTISPSSAYQGLDIIPSDTSAIEVNNNVILAKKAGTYTLVLKTIDESNLSKEITINVSASENPIFITNNEFDNANTLSWNTSFNPLDNIRAFDNKDGEITNSIVLKGEVDNRSYGEYILEYTITDSEGNSQTLLRTVNVVWDFSVTVIGHAGSYYGVPNSEEAILYAAETLKYPAIEIDLKQTKDGVFILSHDPTWGGVSLEQTNYADLKEVEYTVTKTQGIVGAGLSDAQRTYTAKICTFERYLEICKEYHITAIIELKTSAGISNWTEKNAPQTSRMKDIMELIKKYDMLEQVVFLSSQELCLNWVKTNGYDYIPCQYLTLKSCENEETYNIVKQYNLDISFNVRDGIQISDEWLTKYRDLGCKLAVFTFEEYASYSDIQTWINRGVDYVTTDWHVLDNLDLPKNNE